MSFHQIKDHQIAQLVNQLKDIAVKYQGTQQLREVISQVVQDALKETEINVSPGVKKALGNTEKCDKARPGWQCIRDSGHEGPCAARPQENPDYCPHCSAPLQYVECSNCGYDTSLRPTS